MGNASYIKNRCGVLKVFTILIGAISVGLIGFACDRLWKEEIYLGIAIACLVISLLYYIIHLAVTDVELKTSNKAVDSGYHFLAAILLICGGILMVYSAVSLRDDIWYICTSYSLDRGIPCLYNKRYGGYGNSVPLPPIGGNPIGTGGYPGSTYYPIQKSDNPQGRSFLLNKPFSFNWLWGKQEICREILPRILDCNRYYEMKLAGGILGIINAILYGVTGVMVLLS